MKKKNKVLFWLGLFVAISSIILIRPLDNLDEIWNFNMARGIANGLVPYRDINMVITPLSSFVSAAFLKIFGSEMFVTRVLAIFLAVANLFFVYKILKTLKINSQIAHLITLAIAFVIKDYCYMDYNCFLLLLTLVVIWLELKYKDNYNVAKCILIGAIGGLSICTKHTMGLLICAVIVLNKIYFIAGKEDFKKTAKQIAYRIIGIAIPLYIFSWYLLITKSSNYFLDYCVYGLSTFSNKVNYFNLMKEYSIEGVISAIVPMALIIAFVYNIIFRIKKTIGARFYTLTVYSIAMFALVYPIADKNHLIIASIPTLILSCYSAYRLILHFSNKVSEKAKRYIKEFLGIVAVLAAIAFGAYYEIINMDDLSRLTKYREFDHFKYIHVVPNVRNPMMDTEAYIQSQDKETYILDASSALYMIPINRYNKDYDLLLNGNLGSGGEDRIIEEMKSKDARFLILDDNYQLNWQTPMKIRAYVKDNMKYIENVGFYSVYENVPKDESNSEENKEENVNNDENSEQTPKEENAEQKNEESSEEE